MVLVWFTDEILGLALLGLRFGTLLTKLLSSITFIVRYRYDVRWRAKRLATSTPTNHNDMTISRVKTGQMRLNFSGLQLLLAGPKPVPEPRLPVGS